jgi:hypothetical protein
MSDDCGSQLTQKGSSLGSGGSKSNSVVVLVEVSIELSDETISEDEVVEGSGEVLSHDAEDALGLS